MTRENAEHEDRLVWADRLSITIAPVNGEREPDEDHWVSIEADQSEWSREWLDEEILRIGTSGDGEPMFWVEEKRSVVSWGADAAQLEYFVFIASELFSAALGYGVGKLADKLGAKIQARNGGVEFSLPLDEDDATDLARQRVAMRYGSVAGSLVVTKVETRESEVTVGLREPSGLPRYELVYTGRGGRVSTLSCTRFLE